MIHLRRTGLWRVAALVFAVVPATTVAAVSTSASAARATDVAVEISTEPSLFPQFDLKIPDYVVRCQPGTPVQVFVQARPRVKVSVDNGPFNGGSFSAQVSLTPGQSVAIAVKRRAKPAAIYYIRCLPPDLPAWTTTRNGTPQAEWYIVAPTFEIPYAPSGHYVIVFDTNGVPLWWYQTVGLAADAKLFPNRHIAWTNSLGGGGPGTGFEEHALDGSLVRELSTASTRHKVWFDFHDVQLLPNGNYLLMGGYARPGADLSFCPGGPASATIVDNVVQELTPSGSLVWQWDTAGHIAPNDMDPQFCELVLSQGAPFDVYHINSLERTGRDVLLSFRHLDAAYDVSRLTGRIRWKLGGTPRPQSLTILDDPVFAAGSHFGGPHDARMLADGTMTLHDNGTGLGRPPRAVRYQLDLAARTATLVEQLVAPDAASSGCCGSARKLSPTGNWVTDWGMNPNSDEFTSSGSLVFQLTFPNRFSYRTFPVLPGELSRADLRAGMDAQYPR